MIDQEKYFYEINKVNFKDVKLESKEFLFTNTEIKTNVVNYSVIKIWINLRTYESH